MALLSVEQLGIELRIIGSTTHTISGRAKGSIVTNLHTFVYGLIDDSATGRCAGMGKRIKRPLF